MTFPYITSPAALVGEFKRNNYTRAYRLMELSGHDAFTKMSMKECSDFSLSYANDQGRLTEFLQKKPDMVNVFLAPVIGDNSDITVTMIHSCFEQIHELNNHRRHSVLSHKDVLAPPAKHSIIGVIGNRFNGPLVENPIEAFVRPLYNITGRNQNLIVPTLEDIVEKYCLAAGSDINNNGRLNKFRFHELRFESVPLSRSTLSNPETIESVRSSYPNCFMIHPGIVTFNRLGLIHEKGIHPSDMAHFIMQSVLFDRKNSEWGGLTKYSVIKKLQPIYPVLVYLWILGNGFGQNVNGSIYHSVELTMKNDVRLTKHQYDITRMFLVFNEFKDSGNDDDEEQYLVDHDERMKVTYVDGELFMCLSYDTS